MNERFFQKLDFWFQHRVNVLFFGKSGETTAAILEFFKSRGLVDGETSLYFPASKTVEHVQSRHVEALYFDDFNRIPKTQHAVLELLRFKSINGEKFPNLKVVWASAETVHPKDADRFHITVDFQNQQERRLEYEKLLKAQAEKT